MVVLCESKKWELDMGTEIFAHLKRSNPSLKVKLIENTISSYKDVKMAQLRYIQNYSKSKNFKKKMK